MDGFRKDEIEKVNIETKDRIVCDVAEDVLRQELAFYLRAMMRKSVQGNFVRLLAESLAPEIINAMLEDLSLRVPEVATSGDLADKYHLQTGSPQTTQAELRRLLADALAMEIQGYSGPGGDGAPSDFTQP